MVRSRAGLRGELIYSRRLADNYGSCRTSAQGASQAVEDGVALAACLQLAGKDDIPLAVSTWEALR